MPGQDVFTLESIVTPSDEHVIPNFLGGKLLCRRMLDKRTNERFGSGIDSSLEKALRPFLTILDARGDRQRGRPAPTLRGVRSTQGPCYDVVAGGKVIPRPQLKFELGASTLSFKGSAPNEALLKQQLTNWCRKKGLDQRVIEAALATATRTTSVPPELHFDLTLFDTDCYRAVAKIACNLFALDHSPSFMSADFEEIRTWVLGAVDVAPPPVQLLKPLPSTGCIGDLDHFVRVTVATDGSVEGIVQLLGSIAFGVRLGTTGSGMAKAMTYRVDQFTGKESRDAALDLSLSSEPFAEATARSYEEFYELALQAFRALLAKVSARQRTDFVKRLCLETAKELGLAPDAEWDVHEKALFSEAFASKYVEHVLLHQQALLKRNTDADGD